MRRLSNHFVTLLRSIVASPETSVSRLAILEAAEREELVAAVEPPPTKNMPGSETVLDLIGEQVARRPEAIAVSFEGDLLPMRNWSPDPHGWRDICNRWE